MFTGGPPGAAIRRWVAFRGEKEADELKAAMKGNKNPVYSITQELYSGLLPLQRWLRAWKPGQEDEAEPPLFDMDGALGLAKGLVGKMKSGAAHAAVQGIHNGV